MKQISLGKALVVCIVLNLLLLAQGMYALQTEQGTEVPLIFDDGISDKIEIAIYYGRWSLNLFKGLFEDDLIREISEEIQEEILNQVRGIRGNPAPSPTVFDQTFTFDSGGPNYGLEVRLYPQGKEGAFSLGISLDRTKVRLTLVGDVSQNFSDRSSAEVRGAVGEITLNPFFTILSFRWDFKPDWRITPYAVFGIGVAALNGQVRYDYTGSYRWGVFEQEIGEAETRTIKEAEEDSDINFPNILPLLQINFGVRAEIIPHLHLRAEAGIWDGFALRAGFGYRF